MAFEKMRWKGSIWKGFKNIFVGANIFPLRFVILVVLFLLSAAKMFSYWFGSRYSQQNYLNSLETKIKMIDWKNLQIHLFFATSSEFAKLKKYLFTPRRRDELLSRKTNIVTDNNSNCNFWGPPWHRFWMYQGRFLTACFCNILVILTYYSMYT